MLYYFLDNDIDDIIKEQLQLIKLAEKRQKEYTERQKEYTDYVSKMNTKKENITVPSKELKNTTTCNCSFSCKNTNFIFNSIQKVIFNPPATIVIWKDGTKTIVKNHYTERYDKEKGLAMCIIKKLFNNKSEYYELFKKYCEE